MVKIKPEKKNGTPRTKYIIRKVKKPMSGFVYRSLIKGTRFIMGKMVMAKTAKKNASHDIYDAALLPVFRGFKDEYTPARPKQNMARVITI